MKQSGDGASLHSRLSNWFVSEDRQRMLAGIIIGAGVLFRLNAYMHNRSLWINEAMLACGIVQRSFVELLEPLLEYNQSAPLGFLYLVRSAVVAFGPNEYALRLVPLLAGLASLPLFYLLIKRYVGRAAALPGLLLFAVSGQLIYHAIEVKQYSVDVLLTILVLLAVEPLLHGSQKYRHWFLLGATGVVTVWFSHPVVFVLAAAGLVLAGLALYRREWKRLAILAGIGLAWLASFGVNYGLITRHVAANSRKLQGFKDSFMPLSLSLATLEWLRHHMTDLTSRVLLLPNTLGCALIGTVCLMAGTVRMFYRDRVRGLLLVGPVFLCLVASAMHKYPFYERLLLFLDPVLLIPIGLGAHWFIASERRRWLRAVGAIIVGLLVLMPTALAVQKAFTGYSEWEMRPVTAEDAAFVNIVLSPGLSQESYSEIFYYSQVYGYRPDGYIKAGRAPDDMEKYRSELKRLFRKKGPRIWFILGHHERGSLRPRMLEVLDSVATRVDSVEIRRTAAYLYRADFTEEETELPHAENRDAKE